MKKITLLFFMSLMSWCGYSQLALEDFEGNGNALPPGWLQVNVAGPAVSWVVAPHNAATPSFEGTAGTHAAYLNKENVATGTQSEDWLITEPFTVPANPQLNFKSRLTLGGDQGTTYKVMINTTGSTDPADFTLVQNWTELTLNPSQDTYTSKVVPLTATAGATARIAFVMMGDDGDRWLVDMVSVLSECLPPTTLTASNIGLTSADLSWANPSGATEWEIEVLPAAAVPVGSGVVYNGALPYTATPLTQATDYKYYVRSRCSDGGISTWAGPFFFSTVAPGATCGTPLTIATLPYSTSGTTAGFGDDYSGSPGSSGCGSTSNYLNGDDVVYAYTPATTGVISVDMTNNGAWSGIFVYDDCADIGVNCIGGGVGGSAGNPVSLPNISVTAGVTYYFVISTLASPQTTPYTLTIQQVNCAPPAGLTATNVDADSADLGWTNPSGATSWEVVVQAPGAGIPAGSGTTVAVNSNYNVTQTTAGVLFTPATTYEYYVRADCGDGTFSAWVGPKQFTTTQIPATMDFTEDFEGTPGWTLSNGTQTNKWAIGTATSNSPTHSLYISNDNGTSNAFTITSTSVVHAYRDILMPAALDQVVLSYDWKGQGEACCDYLRVWVVPATYTPTPGTQITAAASGGQQVGGNHNMTPAWTTVNTVLNATAWAGQVRRVIFEWRNDGSVGTQPPAAVDNVNLSVVTCPSPTALAITTLTDSSVTFGWTAPSVAPASYDYYFTTTSTPPTDATTPTGNVTTNSATITPLTPSTTYYFWVRSNCGPGDTSFWVGPVSFNTPQIPATLDYSQDFEGASNGWTLSNGTQTNKWVVGTATSNSPTHSLYISNDNGTSNAFTVTSTSVVHAYRDIAIPAGTGDVNISYDWKAVGENCCDYLRVWVVPVTFTPTPGTLITAAASGGSQLGGNWNNNSTWTTQNFVVNAAPFAGTSRRLIFEWRNDGSAGTQPPAAVDNVNVSIITCSQPSAIVSSALTETSVTFSWTAPATAPASYDYYLSTSNTPPTDATVPTGNVTATTVTITPLTPSTTYYFWVRSNCGAGDTSFWTGPSTINTPQIPATLDYSQDFEGASNGWTLSNGTQTNKWVVGTATSNSPTHSLYITNDNGVSNAFTINATSVVHAYRDIMIPAGTADINFSYDWKAVGESCCDYLRVWSVPVTYTPTPGTLITAAASGGTQYGGNQNSNDTWTTQNYIINASAWAGTVRRFIFEWRNDGSIGTQPPAAVDNVNISVITCPQPTNLTATNISMTEALLGWNETGAATAWEVYVIPAGDPAPTADTVGTPADTNSFLYEPLTPGTAYVYYVRAVCADDDKSFWSGPLAFQTALCELADQCPYDFIMIDSFGDSWNGNTMSIIQNGITVATLTGPTNADDTNPVTVTVNLCSGVPFTLFWNSGGSFAAEVGVSIVNATYDDTIFTMAPGTGAQNTALYTGIPACAPITCPQPTDLLAENFDYTTVNLSWTPGGTETQWEVVIQEQDGPYPGDTPAESYIVNDDPTFPATNLVEGVFYEYYVRAICGPDDASFWSGPIDFSIFIPPGCAGVDVIDPNDPELEIIAPGSEFVICYGEEDCVDLSANYFATGTTDEYEVESIDYDPPFPFNGGTPLNVNTDDIWSPVVNLPFEFCFFGEIYDEAKVGSNGVVMFGDNMTNGGYCPWPFTTTIPNAGFPITNAIYGVYQDVNPNAAGDGLVSINYQVLGTYPCRALVVNYYHVPQFSCGDSVGLQTSQIIIYEISNIIEVYVENRTSCTGWNGGNGVLGIQNAAGTEAYTPPGRNTGQWTATNEAWRFVPSGDPNVEFEWLQDGIFLSDQDDITVCVSNPTEMTARVTYTNCNGDEIVKESSFTIRVADEIILDETTDLHACSNGEDVTFDLNEGIAGIVPDPSLYTITFYGSEADAIAGDETAALPEIYTTNTSQTIWVRVADGPCFVTTSFELILSNIPPEFTVTPDFSLCEGTSGTISVTPGNFDPASPDVSYTWTLDGVDLADTTPSISVTTGGVYVVTVNNAGCVGSATTTVTVIPTPVPDAPADVTVCDSYVLPALTVGSYYTETMMGGVELFEGESVTSTQTIYVYADSGTDPLCTAENSFVVTIVPSPVIGAIPPVNACDSYTLPALAVGNYYTETMAGGTMLAAGDVVTTSQTLYVYAETATTPNCMDEEMLVITITPTPVADAPANVAACNTYILPALSPGNNYYTGPGGTGTMLAAGSDVTTTQTLYVYTQSGTAPNICSDENSFTVAIIPTATVMITEGCDDDNAYALEVVFTDTIYTQDDASFEWSFNNSMTGTDSPILVISEPGTYTVTVTPYGDADCPVTATLDVDDVTCEIQRGISPNNDGFNDSFDLSTLGVKKLSIFNRYGKEVYTKNGYSDEWHGQSGSGDELPTGTYFYMVERNNGETRTGWVYVQRQD